MGGACSEGGGAPSAQMREWQEETTTSAVELEGECNEDGMERD